jgi:hypothetical protein
LDERSFWWTFESSCSWDVAFPGPASLEQATRALFRRPHSSGEADFGQRQLISPVERSRYSEFYLAIDDGSAECPGEDPETQIEALLNIVTPASVAELLEASTTAAGREDGYQDEILLAVYLYTTPKQLAELLGLSSEKVSDWIDQAITNFTDVHVVDFDKKGKVPV